VTSAVNLASGKPFPGVFDKFGPLRLFSQLLLLGIVPLWGVLSAVTWLDTSSSKRIATQACALRLPFAAWLQRLIWEATWTHHSLDRRTAIRRAAIFDPPVTVEFVSILVVISVAINLVYISPESVCLPHVPATAD
jgi:hypothetical protein